MTGDKMTNQHLATAIVKYMKNTETKEQTIPHFTKAASLLLNKPQTHKTTTITHSTSNHNAHNNRNPPLT